MPALPNRPHVAPHGLSRRRFLIGAASLAAAAACGSDGGSSATATSTPKAKGELALGQFFDPNGLAHTDGEQRLPVGLFTAGRLATFDEAPSELEIQLLSQAPGASGDPIEVRVPRHGQGMPRPYYPLRASFDRTGPWEARTVVEGQELTMSFNVSEPAAVEVVRVGQPMPSVETPTVDDARGVVDICTREPDCPFHQVSLAGAMDANSPTVLMVSTPALCQTAVCGPVLDVLIDQVEGSEGFQTVHAEVFVDPTVDDQDRQPTEIMSALGLVYEPALFFVGADGVVRERLDNIFDAAEIAAALEQLTA